MTEAPTPSVRGLVDSEFYTPLRKITGILDSMYREDRQFGTFVVLNLKELEVIKSVEPYILPIAQISIKESNKKNSAWGLFGESLVQLLGEDEDVKDCVGRRIGLEMEEAHVYGKDRQTQEDMVGVVWRAYSLEGAAGGKQSAAARAKELLIGKTRAEFNKLAYADPLIKADPALQRAITDRSFINALVQTGEVAEDANGVFSWAPGKGTAATPPGKAPAQ